MTGNEVFLRKTTKCCANSVVKLWITYVKNLWADIKKRPLILATEVRKITENFTNRQHSHSEKQREWKIMTVIES